MAGWWGLGPVFEAEWLTTTRRWQIYGGRVLFLGILLLALTSIWISRVSDGTELTIRDMASIGRGFFAAIVFTQLTLVLLAVPAMTASSICQDKARGNLTQLLMTDLSDREIVLGKMAARLIPLLAMICGTLPVLMLCALLGGIDPLALTGTFAVSVGLAILCCAITFTFSIWGTKPYEVLLATFALLAIWLLAFPIWEFFTWLKGLPPLPHWGISAHPFFLAFAPYARPGTVGVIDYIAFTLIVLLISVILMLTCIVKLRPVVIGQQDLSTARRTGRGAAIFGFGNGPALDANPVLWYEWHRNRPSTWIRRLIRLYFSLAIGFSLLAIEDIISPTSRMLAWFPAFVNAFQFAMGLPLLLVAAAMALVEERSRGSLDILLTTPLSSRSIVLAKWWSVFRQVPRLLWLPILVATILACVTDNWWPLVLFVLFVVVVSAAWTSIGLALSTWISRPSRAVTVSVILYAFASLGWPLMALTIFGNDRDLGATLSDVSPFHGIFDLTCSVGGLGWFQHVHHSLTTWSITYALVGVLVLAAILATFDHALGRVPEKCRRRPAP